jgi:uncharacterized protein YndB with AHSA1/START domain
MSNQEIIHGKFVIERTYEASPAEVFAAWADPAVKARWFIGPTGWTAIRRELDFRIGGEELLSTTCSWTTSITPFPWQLSSFARRVAERNSSLPSRWRFSMARRVPIVGSAAQLTTSTDLQDNFANERPYARAIRNF